MCVVFTAGRIWECSGSSVQLDRDDPQPPLRLFFQPDGLPTGGAKVLHDQRRHGSRHTPKLLVSTDDTRILFTKEKRKFYKRISCRGLDGQTWTVPWLSIVVDESLKLPTVRIFCLTQGLQANLQCPVSAAYQSHPFPWRNPLVCFSWSVFLFLFILFTLKFVNDWFYTFPQGETWWKPPPSFPQGECVNVLFPMLSSDIWSGLTELNVFLSGSGHQVQQQPALRHHGHHCCRDQRGGQPGRSASAGLLSGYFRSCANLHVEHRETTQ